MAPIKFENNMKETLEKRSLQPSENAWEKLSQRLDESEKKKNAKSYWWIGVAASIVLLISVGIIFLNDNDSKENLPTLVQQENGSETINTETDSNQIDIQLSIKLENEKEVDQFVENVSVETKNEPQTKVETKVVVENQNAKTEQPRIKVTENNAVAEVEIIEPKPIMIFEDEKLKEVVAEIQKRQSESSSVTDREIDSLLKAAQREIITNKIYNESTKTVNADALLRDVEEDLDQSFRTKVFDALKNGYESVKTSVAERNQR